MLIYLYGPDAYRRSRNLQEVIKKFTDKHSALNLRRFDLARDEELHEIKEFAAAQSLFDSFKLGIIYSPEAVEPKELNGALKLVGKSANVSLVVVADKALPKSVSALGDREVIKRDFNNLEADKFLIYAKQEAEKRGVKLSEQEWRPLVVRYQADTWGLINELEKISLGGNPQSAFWEHDFFSTLNRLQRAGSPAASLPILERLMAFDDPAKIFNVFASLSADKKKMADYDVAIKSGKLEYEEVLLSLTLGGR